MALLHLAIILALVGQTTCTAQTKLLRGASRQSWTKLWRVARQHGTPAKKLEYSSDDNPDMTKLHEEDLQSLEVDHEEDIDDAIAWKTGQPLNLASRTKLLPPKCPSDVSETGPYFQELVAPYGHVDCDYRQPCSKKGTNLARLNSIRGVLGRIKTLMNGIGVGYVIHAGSAIGQQRCGDVLPWDTDCDIAVWENDIPRIAIRDLDAQYVVRQKSLFIPRTVVDKRTGFYCDIFPMKNKGTMVEFPWPWGNRFCKGQAVPMRGGGTTPRCWQAPYTMVAPFRPCTLNGVQHTCMKDQLGFLTYMYGGGVLGPNRTTTYLKNGKPPPPGEFDWVFHS